MAERLAAQWPEDGAEINDLEDFAERMAHDVQRELSKRTLQPEAERKESNQSACPCGSVATFQRYHGLTVATAAGRVRVHRAYYHCAACGQGHCPVDARFRLGPANTTPTAQARLAVLSALEPYVRVAHLTRQLGLPLDVDLKSTERVAQGVGVGDGAAPGAQLYGSGCEGRFGARVWDWEGVVAGSLGYRCFLEL